MAVGTRKRVVVVGLGMVGISFIEKLLKLDARAREYNITVVGEEKHVAYNRVGLTTFFEHRKVEKLYLNPLDWYESILDGALSYHTNTKVTKIDRSRKTISCADGAEIEYDILVLATGSDAVLPQFIPNYDATGVFVYRTVDDLEKLIDWSASQKGSVGAVVGGGLLGLEAAKALLDLECYSNVKVLERNGWVLSRQLDADAGGMVVEQVRSLGVDVMLKKSVASIEVDEERRVTGVKLVDGESFACSTLCFAIGVKPRDELGREAGLRCADRTGGIIVDNQLRTSDPDIYAIGECASWEGQTFGLIAPGVEMADVLSFNLTQAKHHQPRLYKQPDLSTKLKLLGVEVASFGDYFADIHGPKFLPAKVKRASRANGANGTNKTDDVSSTPVKALTYKDPFQNVYKKYIFTMDGKYLLGGMMIGDTRDYVKLVPIVKNQKELEIPPAELILGAKKEGGDDGDDLDDDTQICSCHNVTKGDVVKVVKDGSCKSIGDVKTCTKAGTGCGGCLPLVTSIFNKTMRDMGNEVKNHLCPHFNYSRADLYNIIMVKRLRTLPEVMREAGTDPDSLGCEVCKPCLASIFASLWNKHVMDKPHHGLQDTNDRYLGNIQRNGTYSVVPRMAGGEITPDKLLAIAQVAKDYNLYTKITGGQRIDMFGAKKQDLLHIWKRLVDAGMESGHAYAKSLRTVKSCVGTTWCRFGVGDSVGMAVRLEERYKSIRAPHKIKGGVSGCVRECAEAQNKDFGLIATDKGFNILVAGNGGAKPKHCELLAKDVPPTEVIPILDRYLMFYIRTADKLQRTARWLESLPGGINYLRSVILDDSLGICASLEAQMQELVDSYFDEWAEAINNPSIAAKFTQFANTTETLETMDTEQDRLQTRPVMWPKESVTDDFASLRSRWSETTWQPVLEASYFRGADSLPNGISATIKRGDTQLAVWRFKGRYYGTQQMCPHKRAFVLSDSLVGEDPPTQQQQQQQQEGEKEEKPAPWISCPHHKRNFSLTSGACKSDADLSIATFDVEERPDGMVYMKLPPVEELDAALGTKKWMVKKGEAGPGQFAEVDKKIGFVGQRAKKVGVKPVGGLNGNVGMRKGVELMAVSNGNGGGCGGAPEW
ncbi:nitrite reductase [Parathielavia appendiculata]|uniref:Nitrite reductase [NAD(P)H] n=1 Tax=Parathielavia appendiculata TaxID=2587402 RepID=A0AAN6TRG3_9PEZI|nr:nitrite reductase [Parathielavia appendiculata]